MYVHVQQPIRFQLHMYVRCMSASVGARTHTPQTDRSQPRCLQPFITRQSLSRLGHIAADKVHRCTGEVFKVS